MHGEIHAPVDRPADRADIVTPLLAKAPPVPVTPKERVRREEGGHDVQYGGAVQLVGAHELGMNDHRPMIRRHIHAGERLIDPIQHEVHRRVAVRMGKERHTASNQRGRPRLVELRVHRAVGAIVGPGSRRSFFIRFGDPGRSALGRAVQDELDTGHAKTAPIGLFML